MNMRTIAERILRNTRGLDVIIRKSSKLSESEFLGEGFSLYTFIDGSSLLDTVDGRIWMKIIDKNRNED